MTSRLTLIVWLMGILIVEGAIAQDADVAAGEKLYVAQCKICHGTAEVTHTGDRTPTLPESRFVQLAMEQASVTDAAVPTIFRRSVTATHEPEFSSGRYLAFAPPFGPNLQGVYGRLAGTAKGYEYSSTFLKALTGMEWNDAALDVWITNPQAWVPGVYMFYKQPDPEVRHKIIAYLKANRQ